MYSDWEPKALRLEKTYSEFQNRTANTNKDMSSPVA